MDAFTGLSPDIESCCSADVVLSQTLSHIVVESRKPPSPLVDNVN